MWTGNSPFPEISQYNGGRYIGYLLIDLTSGDMRGVSIWHIYLAAWHLSELSEGILKLK